MLYVSKTSPADGSYRCKTYCWKSPFGSAACCQVTVAYPWSLTWTHDMSTVNWPAPTVDTKMPNASRNSCQLRVGVWFTMEAKIQREPDVPVRIQDVTNRSFVASKGACRPNIRPASRVHRRTWLRRIRHIHIHIHIHNPCVWKFEHHSK